MSTVRSAAAIAAGIAVRHDQAGAAAEQLDGVREAVATTGLPAATASISTPEVTWSVES